MFYKHPDSIQHSISEKIETLHREATNEVVAKAKRLRWRQLTSHQFATHLRKLADKLEPHSNPIPNQHLTKQVQ